LECAIVQTREFVDGLSIGDGWRGRFIDATTDQ